MAVTTKQIVDKLKAIFAMMDQPPPVQRLIGVATSEILLDLIVLSLSHQEFAVFECVVMGEIKSRETDRPVSARQVSDDLGLPIAQASTLLKRLCDYHLLQREEQRTGRRWFLYRRA